MKRIHAFAGLGLALMSAASVGCGGTEPLSVVNVAAFQLALPITESSVIQKVDPYNTTGSGAESDGFDIYPTALGVNVASPGQGIVMAVDNTLGSAAVYIYHGPHLTTRITKLQTVSVQAGSILQAGSVLGISSSNNINQPVRFTVLYDNGLVCPLSYLNATAQTLVRNRLVGGVPPCL